jgi:hypothetical protein
MWVPLSICLQEKKPRSWREIKQRRVLSARASFFLWMVGV